MVAIRIANGWRMMSGVVLWWEPGIWWGERESINRGEEPRKKREDALCTGGKVIYPKKKKIQGR